MKQEGGFIQNLLTIILYNNSKKNKWRNVKGGVSKIKYAVLILIKR